MCLCVCACVCTHLCAQKNDRLTHLFMRIFLLARLTDIHFVVIFVALSSCAELFFYGNYSVFIFQYSALPPYIFVTHDETNQAKCNKSSNEQTGQI